MAAPRERGRGTRAYLGQSEKGQDSEQLQQESDERVIVGVRWCLGPKTNGPQLEGDQDANEEDGVGHVLGGVEPL